MLQKWYLDLDTVEWYGHMAETPSSVYKMPQTEIYTSHSQPCLPGRGAANIVLCSLCSHLHLQFPKCTKPNTWWLQAARRRGHHWWMLCHHLITDHYQNKYVPSFPFTSILSILPIILESVCCGHEELGPKLKASKKMNGYWKTARSNLSKMLLVRDKRLQENAWMQLISTGEQPLCWRW